MKVGNSPVVVFVVSDDPELVIIRHNAINAGQNP